MAIEFKIRLDETGLTVSEICESATSGTSGKGCAQEPPPKSNQMGGSSGHTLGVGGGGNPETGPGGGGNPETGPGGGGNPETGPGGKGLTPPGPGKTGGQSCPPSSPNRPFQMEVQQESEWCWAAVSASVERYLQPNSYVSQCEIASQVMEADCCTQPDEFDEPEMLQDALDAVGRLRGVTGRLTFEQLQSEINANRPVCIRIAWDGGGAHFLALSGFNVPNSRARTVDVADPFYGESTEDFDLFPRYYHGGGTWTATFLTK